MTLVGMSKPRHQNGTDSAVTVWMSVEERNVGKELGWREEENTEKRYKTEMDSASRSSSNRGELERTPTQNKTNWNYHVPQDCPAKGGDATEEGWERRRVKCQMSVWNWGRNTQQRDISRNIVFKRKWLLIKKRWPSF